MNARPFRILVVADDRKVLRRLSRFLSVFGFTVEPVADSRQACTVCRADPPDFLIVDGDSVPLKHCRQLLSHSQDVYTYTFLMAGEVDTDSLTEALVAGIDDFLAKPIVYGELLARLRSGARVLEYERRMREQSAIDRTTALLSQSAFRDRLQSELNFNGKQAISCVVIDLDFFGNIHRMHGRGTSDEVLRSVASQIKNMAGECKYLASFGAGRFAAVLPNTSDAQALAWSETVRQAISDLEIPLAHETISVTACLGVSSTTQHVSSAGELIERAKEAVRMAKSSGRNCVARCGQFDGETREWEDLARQGRLFENTLARDVMVPCPVFAGENQDLRQAAELLKNSRFGEIPVVDRQGKVLGLLNSADLPETAADNDVEGLTVSSVMNPDVVTVPEDHSFGALMEFFMSDSQSKRVVVVVRQKKPVGLVYRSGLASLSEPLNVASFSPDRPYTTSSDYLVVPDHCCSE